MRVGWLMWCGVVLVWVSVCVVLMLCVPSRANIRACESTRADVRCLSPCCDMVGSATKQGVERSSLSRLSLPRRRSESYLIPLPASTPDREVRRAISRCWSSQVCASRKLSRSSRLLRCAPRCAAQWWRAGGAPVR